MNLKENKEFLEKYTLVFLGTADEEAGMTGALTSLRGGVMDDSILLIIGESSNFDVGIAEKGIAWIEINIYGKAAHGSTPELGLNSIEYAMKLIPQISKCLRDDENEILGKSSINISKIKGGTATNIVPEQTTITIDFRVIPEQNVKALVKNLQNIDITPCTHEVKLTYTLPALYSDTNHKFLQILREINKSNFVGFPYATDAAILVKQKKPVPFVIYGPGTAENAHQVDEHIDIKDVYKSTELLTRALLQTYL
jgi:succinyl-diaminopimelate desuccinylase